MQMSESDFDLYKLRVERFLRNPDYMDLEKLVRDIKAAAFMNKITDGESDYLLDMLPLDSGDEFDDGPEEPEEITRRSGGIRMDDVGDSRGIRRRVPDDLDDFDDEPEEEVQSGFGDISGYQTRRRQHDDLDDFEDEPEEEIESGFGSFSNYDRRRREHDDLDDFDDGVRPEEPESGFGSFSNYDHRGSDLDEFDDLDDFDEDPPDDGGSSGFLGLL